MKCVARRRSGRVIANCILKAAGYPALLSHQDKVCLLYISLYLFLPLSLSLSVFLSFSLFLSLSFSRFLSLYLRSTVGSWGGAVSYERGTPVHTPLGTRIACGKRLFQTALCTQGLGRPSTLHPTPSTLHPTPYTLHPPPHTLHPTPHTLHPTPHTLHPTPYTLNPEPLPLKQVLTFDAYFWRARVQLPEAGLC